MTETETGWVIINIGHPRTGNKFMNLSSFRFTKRECIANFIATSGNPWKYWHRKFNFRYVRANSTITTY
jgi:hypothetical protein